MYGYDTFSQMMRDPNLRASDADREATADRLREHHTDGRIDAEEFHERLDKCYAAKTVGQLAELTRDLPGNPARRRSGAGFSLLGSLRMIPIVPIILALVAIHVIIGLVSGLFGVFSGLWVLIPLFFLGRLLFFRRGFRGRRGAAL
jgi:hypothetical protein